MSVNWLQPCGALCGVRFIAAVSGLYFAGVANFGSLANKSSAQPAGSVLIASTEQTQLNRQWRDRAARGAFCVAVKLIDFAYVSRTCSLKRGYTETYRYTFGDLVLDQSLLAACWPAEVAALGTSRSRPTSADPRELRHPHVRVNSGYHVGMQNEMRKNQILQSSESMPISAYVDGVANLWACRFDRHSTVSGLGALT